MSESTALLRLQEIDLELLRDASTLQNLPQQAKIKTIGLARKKVASELKKIIGQRKDAQTDIDDNEAALNHYLEVRDRVQADAAQGDLTHREVRDLENSLTHLAKMIEKCNFAKPSLEEKLNKLQVAEANAQKTIERLDQEEEAQRASYKEDSATVHAAIISLNYDRKRIAAQISDDVMARYEAARKRFGGLAVESLVGNVPTICRVKLQPSLFHDLVHGPEIGECPYCHRMLITTSEDGE